MRRAVVAMLAAVTATFGLVRVMSVEPKTAEWSGWTGSEVPNNRVSEVITTAFDSLVYCELFSGWASEEQYDVDVYTYPGGTRIAYGNETDNGDHVWIHFDITTTYPESIIKGKQLEFRFSHGAGGTDSIQFYYDAYAGTEYDSLIVPGGSFQPPPGPATPALAMRCYGAMAPVPETYLGFNFGLLAAGSAAIRQQIADKAHEAGVGWNRHLFNWVEVQPDSPGPFDFAKYDIAMAYSAETLDCRVLGLLAGCPDWASTHIVDIEVTGEGVDTVWSNDCPPRNLFEPVFQGDSANPDNYWARYVQAVVTRCNSVVDVYEALNEANWIAEFWQVPNSHYTVGEDTAYGMCSLYVRLCVVTDSVIDSLAGGDSILVGAMSEVESDDDGRVKGKQWLRLCYEVAKDLGYGVFWDGVSVHPYSPADDWRFRPARFEANAETLRAVMRENGDYGPLWSTELGWQSGGEAPQPDYVCETFVTGLGSEVRPGGGYDAMCWFTYLDWPGSCGDFGLLDADYDRKPSQYASGHTYTHLTGKRLNGRVMLGDERDTLVRLYEFEDPADNDRRMWVGWKNGGGSFDLVLPAMTDSVAITPLTYTPGPPVGVARACGSDGWLRLAVTARPVFVTETGDGARPDLRADSAWSVPARPQVGRQCSLYVRATNHGTRAIPAAGLRDDGRPATVARFHVDGRLAGEKQYRPGLAAGETVTLAIAWTPATGGAELLRATVNGDQAYVEESMDDNAAYRFLTVSD